jgi:hypothetical protein
MNFYLVKYEKQRINLSFKPLTIGFLAIAVTKKILQILHLSE